MAEPSSKKKPRRVMGATIDLAVRLAGPAPAGRRRAEGEGVGRVDVGPGAAAPGRPVIAVLPDTIPVDATGRALPCVGRRRVGAGPKKPCTHDPVAEVIRACHGTSKVSVLCAEHLGHVLNGGSTKCADCEALTVTLVAVLPIGGAF